MVTPGKEQYARPMDINRNASLHPFPQNLHCKTASVISEDLKQKIYSEVVESNVLPQEIAHKYGIKLTRVEAIVKLQQIEKSWREQVCYFYSFYLKYFGLTFPGISRFCRNDELFD